MGRLSKLCFCRHYMCFWYGDAIQHMNGNRTGNIIGVSNSSNTNNTSSLTDLCCLEALTQGAAAALRDRSKYKAHAGHLHPGHTFVPASIKTYGHLGKPVMGAFRTPSDIASTRSQAVTRGSFLARGPRELSVALAQSQSYEYRTRAFARQGFWAAGVAWGGHSFP
jgi:hypothetical protein